MEDDMIAAPEATLAEENAYLLNRNLSTLEAEVLGEYARMAASLEKVNKRTTRSRKVS